MSAMVAIIKKEIRTHFLSPLAYVMIGLFLLIMGVIFAKFAAIYMSMKQQSMMGGGQGVNLDKIATYLYQNMAFVMCFLTPFVTMKLFAEERRQHTLELLFTAPVRGIEIVLGKFIASLMLMSFMIAISFIYVGFMVAWGTPELPLIFTTYLGLFFALSCYLSIGCLISATTESQAIAAIFTFIILLLLYLLQSIAQGMTVNWGPIEWGPTLTYISPLGHFNSFTEGLLQIKDLVYFVTFTGFMLFLTHRVVDSHRWR